MTKSETTTMTKREATTEALIAATVELLGEKTAAEVTVKTIAARAGVNHGLVHHYFASKENLLAVAVRRSAVRLYDGQPEALQAGYTFRFFRENADLIRILARVVLEGSPELLTHLAPPPARFDGWIEQLTQVLQRVGLSSEVDPVILNALSVAAMMGWVAFQPLLREAFRVGEGADDELQRWLDRLDAFAAATLDVSNGPDRTR